MVPPGTQPTTGSTFSFKKNKAFLGEKVDVGVVATAVKDEKVALALAHNQPFPEQIIKVGEISLAVQGGESIQFGKGLKKVTFSGGAEAFSGLGVYPDPKSMLKDLRPDENIAPGVEFTKDPNSLYLMLRWGYGLSGAVKGAVALGTGAAVTFGAEGNRQGAFAVIRRLPKATGARTAVKETVQSWILPRQVSTHRDLQPGTWLVAEVNGSIAASLGVEFGYDFNWVHEAELGGLSGDIGLRLQLGVAAALGFEASGKYALVVARESLDKKDKVVRLGLFKLSTRGWNFALTSGIQVKGDFKKFLPDQADDFIKAVFGVHGEQIIRDLHAIEKWTDPDTDLSDELAGLTSKYGQELLKDATGIDPKTAFQEARGRLLDLIRKWDDLDHRVSTLVWKFVEKNHPD